MKMVDAQKMTEVLGFKRKAQVYDAVRQGHIPAGVAVRIGRKVRFDLDAVQAWMARGGTALNQSQSASAAAQ